MESKPAVREGSKRTSVHRPLSPYFTNCIQNDVTTVLVCPTCGYLKSTSILLLLLFSLSRILPSLSSLLFLCTPDLSAHSRGVLHVCHDDCRHMILALFFTIYKGGCVNLNLPQVIVILNFIAFWGKSLY